MKVLVPLADGCEEMEAVIVIDLLRRAQWEVTTAGLVDGVVTASRGVKLVPDATWEKIDPGAFDIIVLPGGGKGTEHLMADARVLGALKQFHAAGKLLAAVCAGPLVLQKAGVLDGKKATCHPGVATKLTHATRLNDRVVKDRGVITSQGAGTTIEFALAIIEHVDGREKAAEVAKGIVA